MSLTWTNKKEKKDQLSIYNKLIKFVEVFVLVFSISSSNLDSYIWFFTLFSFICFLFFLILFVFFYWYIFILFIFLVLVFIIFLNYFYWFWWCYIIIPHHSQTFYYLIFPHFLFKIINLFSFLGQIYNLVELSYFFLLLKSSYLRLIVIMYVLLRVGLICFWSCLLFFIFFIFSHLVLALFVTLLLSIIKSTLSDIPITIP